MGDEVLGEGRILIVSIIEPVGEPSLIVIVPVPFWIVSLKTITIFEARSTCESPSTGENINGLGIIVSIVIVTLLFVSAPSILKLPVGSVNLLLATLITPLVVLLVVGVNVAV